MEHLLLSQKGKKIVINSQSYENENELQEIIKSNPNLINLSSIFESPIMIIGREFDYIDVLGITVDAVPVIDSQELSLAPWHEHDLYPLRKEP